MPYQTELKRPDLKGEFPCSVCGRVFCHSSSLSRHRIQAHFSNYCCTLCKQEISSNESLRSHMSKHHQITRVFMCRCCNWAFPDKMNLHIHITCMAKDRTSGDATVLARSYGENGESFTPAEHPAESTDSSASVEAPEKSKSPSKSPQQVQPVPQQSPIPFNFPVTSHPFYHQAFMQQLEQMKIAQQRSLQQQLGQIQSSPWTENNHFVQNYPALRDLKLMSTLFGLLPNGKRTNSSGAAENEPPKKKLSTGTDCLSVATSRVVENTLNGIKAAIEETVATSEVVPKPNKRKSKKPQRIPDAAAPATNVDVPTEDLLKSKFEIFDDPPILSTQHSESSSSTTISDVDASECAAESQEFIKDDKTSDYIQRLSVINDLISKFINLVETQNFEQGKQSALAIAQQILKQCIV